MDNSPKKTKLQLSEERYQKMIAEVQDYAILLMDTEGNIQNWNLGAEQIKGYKRDEIVGKNFRLFYRECDREAQLPESLINEARTTGRAMHEGWRVRKDGSTFWGSVVITALHDDGEVIGFSKVTRDLTERKLAEDQIREYARDIEYRNRQLEEFAYIASHDLQEPLRKLQLFADLLQTNIDNKASSLLYSGKIAQSANRMSNLIKGILQYTQLSADVEYFDAVNLSATLTEVQDDLDLLLKEKNVSIYVAPLPQVKGNAIQMQQLFTNLISNAIKFSGTAPQISVETYELTDTEIAALGDKASGFVKILVADNGVGFDQHYAEQIFKIFKRLTDKPGTGIGLALCKKIVENHGGQITVESKTDYGTTFTLLLPKAIT
ncbi:sensor histidine kinase [Flavobacterium sp. RHBU_3]|uniref:sensor histidine kinase n=1 Tax=Flavobacterium sp. RHBU_3 TaxID=3391184 RepID=UPI003984799B